MKYQVWVGDLDSLYNEMDGVASNNPPTLAETCDNYIQAREAVSRLCGPNTAAWIQDVNGNVIP